MKKILLPVLLIGLLTACDKNNDDDKKATQSLTGKWQNTKIEMYSGSELVNTETIEEENSTCPDYTEFKSDGSFLYVDMDADCEKDVDELGTYIFDGTNLKTTYDEGSGTYKISSITASQFVLEQSETENGVTYKIKSYFKKLK
ncbi:MAG: lipocalin family protein [Flavobacterium sp.]